MVNVIEEKSIVGSASRHWVDPSTHEDGFTGPLSGSYEDQLLRSIEAAFLAKQKVRKEPKTGSSNCPHRSTGMALALRLCRYVCWFLWR